ncbi:family 78 glycoside hydrolase catalytic domain [Microlunatus soli]|uniref:alpha-L-rhamnosidase n=1 Tax=Microlunatus soli TaxID=630515 RepID=A0A1H2ADC0_9ACTN|nr:family 78 glycoside hydrolase catalytic domain [Microlunatus soli]SDT43970.1 Alpha-L-rhamnosidase N-terminal domain-containing protein [Microlunatus soli]
MQTELTEPSDLMIRATPIWCVDASADWCFVRQTVVVDHGRMTRATLLITAASTEPSRQYVYRAHLNGQVVGVGPARPIGGETRVDRYDVTDLIVDGSNAIGALLYTTDDHRCAAELVIELVDGNLTRVGTGTDWQAISGAACYPPAASIGTACYPAPAEDLDARHYPHGFDTAEFEQEWPAAVARPAFDRPVGSPLAPVRREAFPVARELSADRERIVLDFGRSWAGGAIIRAVAQAGDRIELRFGEVLVDTDSPDPHVRFELTAGNVYRDTWTLTEGEQELATWGLRVFRYLEIRFLDGHPDLTDIRAAALIYDFDDDAAEFSSSDLVLDRVWDLCKHTVKALNLNLYVDSWTRERLPYEADAYLQQRAHLALDRDPALARYSVDFTIAHRTWPTEWPLFAVLAIHDLWYSTGDFDQLRPQYERLTELLPTRWIDPGTGLVRKPGSDGSTGDMDRGGFDRDLVDWPPSERDGYRFGAVNTVLNALSYRCFRAAAELADAVGDPGVADEYRAIAGRLSSAIDRLLFDSGYGSYVDGLDDSGRRLGHHAIHAAAYALWAGVVPEDRVGSVIGFLAGRGMACSVFGAPVLLEGLFDHGAGQVAIPMITAPGNRSWRHMLEVGAGAAMEAWDVEFKPNLTHSHPWGATPAFLLPQGILGVRPIEPGFRRFLVRPQLGALTQAAARIPVPTGSIEVDGRRTADGADYVITVPAGTRARFGLPAAEATDQTIDLDGRPVRTRLDSRWLELDNDLAAGRHTIRCTATR